MLTGPEDRDYFSDDLYIFDDGKDEYTDWEFDNLDYQDGYDYEVGGNDDNFQK